MGEFQASALVAFPVPGLLRFLLWQRRIDFATATAHKESAHACSYWASGASPPSRVFGSNFYQTVDSLYRDDTGEISRDLRIKRLKTR